MSEHSAPRAPEETAATGDATELPWSTGRYGPSGSTTTGI